MARRLRDVRARMDEQLIRDLREARRQRMINRPDENPRELSDREMSRMARNTDGWRIAMRELATKPRNPRKMR